jgi:hypothetical protein
MFADDKIELWTHYEVYADRELEHQIGCKVHHINSSQCKAQKLEREAQRILLEYRKLERQIVYNLFYFNSPQRLSQRILLKHRESECEVVCDLLQDNHTQFKALLENLSDQKLEREAQRILLEYRKLERQIVYNLFYFNSPQRLSQRILFKNSHPQCKIGCKIHENS